MRISCACLHECSLPPLYGSVSLNGSCAFPPPPMSPCCPPLARSLPRLLSTPNPSVSATRRLARATFCPSKSSMKSSRMAPWIEARCGALYLGGRKWISKSEAMEGKKGGRRFLVGACRRDAEGKGRVGPEFRERRKMGGWRGGGRQAGGRSQNW